VSSSRPTTNFKTLSNLYVGNGNTAQLRFDLSGLSTFPITSSQIAKATLTIFVNRVNTAGTVNLLTVSVSPANGTAVAYATDEKRKAVIEDSDDASRREMLEAARSVKGGYGRTRHT